MGEREGMKQIASSIWLRGFVTGIIVSGALALALHAQESHTPPPQPPKESSGGIGTYSLTAIGSDVFCLDTRTGQMWRQSVTAPDNYQWRPDGIAPKLIAGSGAR